MNNTSENYLQTMSSDDAWLSATGPVPIRMSNDYLFRALLQRSNTTLKGLICSLPVQLAGALLMLSVQDL